jgi:hypothetical protein
VFFSEVFRTDLEAQNVPVCILRPKHQGRKIGGEDERWMDPQQKEANKLRGTPLLHPARAHTYFFVAEVFGEL